MTTYGPQGFTFKRQPDYVKDIEDYQIANIERKFKYQNNKIIYQINSIFALQIDQLSQLIQASFSSLYLSKAEGVWLDELSLLRGVPRLPASSSFTTSQYVKIKPGTVIPTGSLFSSDVLSYTAYNISDVEADTVNSFETKFLFSPSISSKPGGLTYAIVVNGSTYSYVSAPFDDSGDVADAIIADMLADTGRTWEPVLGTSPSGLTLTIVPDSGTVVSTQSLNTLITTLYTKVYFRVNLVDTGAIEIPAETINKLVSPIAGVEETLNDDVFVVGRERETDASLRLRIASGPTSDATGTVLAIENDILTKVENVSFVKVYENTDQYPVDTEGRLFSQIEVLVVGGDDQDVAKQLFRSKGAGISTMSTTPAATPILISDDKGNSRSVFITRPTQKHIAFKVEYSLGEGALPIDAVILMEEAILSKVGTQGLGQDVVPNKYIGSVYQAVTSGLGTVNVYVQELANSGDPVVPASWQTSVLVVGDTEYATSDGIDVTVVAV